MEFRRPRTTRSSLVLLGFMALITAASVIAASNPNLVIAAPSPEITPTASASPATENVLLPKGTLIVVAVRRSYKSYGASAGTKISYDVVQDVVVNGYLIVQAGDVAEGQILNAREGDTNFWTGETKGANLRVSVDKIFNYCGDTIETDFARSEFRNSQGLFGGKKDVEISKGQKYQVPTFRPQRVCATKTSSSPLPLPSDALEGDKS